MFWISNDNPADFLETDALLLVSIRSMTFINVVSNQRSHILRAVNTWTTLDKAIPAASITPLCLHSLSVLTIRSEHLITNVLFKYLLQTTNLLSHSQQAYNIESKSPKYCIELAENYINTESTETFKETHMKFKRIWYNGLS